MLYGKYFKTLMCNSCSKRKKKLVSLNVIPKYRPIPVVNAALETPSVIAVDVIRRVFAMVVITTNAFLFVHKLQFH